MNTMQREHSLLYAYQSSQMIPYEKHTAKYFKDVNNKRNSLPHQLWMVNNRVVICKRNLVVWHRKVQHLLVYDNHAEDIASCSPNEHELWSQMVHRSLFGRKITTRNIIRWFQISNKIFLRKHSDESVWKCPNKRHWKYNCIWNSKLKRVRDKTMNCWLLFFLTSAPEAQPKMWLA